MTGPTDDVTLTFGGNATTLLRLGPFTVLTDPNFVHRGQRVYLGKGLWTKRLTEPALQPTQLPALDAILLSHLHGDHWDRIATRSLDKGLPVITTQEAAKALAQRGFRETADLRPWQTHELRSGGDTLRITSVPGVHGPQPVAKLLPPVMGSVLELLRDGGPAPLAGARDRRGRRDAADHLGARRARTRPAGEGPAAGDGQRAGAAARGLAQLAGVHQRRHPLPALPR